MTPRNVPKSVPKNIPNLFPGRINPQKRYAVKRHTRFWISVYNGLKANREFPKNVIQEYYYVKGHPHISPRGQSSSSYCTGVTFNNTCHRAPCYIFYGYSTRILKPVYLQGLYMSLQIKKTLIMDLVISISRSVFMLIYFLPRIFLFALSRLEQVAPGHSTNPV